MKIVRRGRIPGDDPAEWECKKCHSLISSRMFEGKYTPDSRDGDCVVFKCPVCSEENWVSASRFR